ncbi:ras GEF [Cylindrobasidium torrendii FP15055 ss-10]|uniref:Ras GEF n=1 Tax=Cylindrobasidium torrendii FP15055 ss-10 TaxID=1314674 RepID=A0A0D7AZ85_9AGAR|nr:ras GEF [Cylindrobasidium torrendii FP15055 ss-10]
MAEIALGVIGLLGVIEPIRNGLVGVHSAVNGVKTHRRQCEQLRDRYIELARTLQGDPAAEEGEPFVEDLTTMLNQAEIQLSRWAKYGRMETLLYGTEVKKGLEKLEKGIENFITKFQIDVSLTTLRGQSQAHTAHDAREMHDETRELLLQALRVLHSLHNQDGHTVMGENQAIRVDLGIVSVLPPELNSSPLPLRPELEQDLRNGLSELERRMDYEQSVSTAPGPCEPPTCDPVGVLRASPARSLAVLPPPTQPSRIYWANDQSPPIIPPVKLGADGRVEAGTFDALIDKLLISASSVPQDLDFFDVFISTCSEFSSQIDVLQALYKRFHDAECDRANQRVEVQLSVYDVLLTWIPNERLPIETAVLDQVKRLCSGRCSYGRSVTMKGRADATLAAVEKRQNGAFASRTSLQLLTLPKSSRIADSVDIARAFTQRQALLFDSITPADWLHFLKSGDGSLHGAVSTTTAVSRNIGKWVTRSLLHYKLIDGRVDTLFYFLDLARAFRDVGNYEGLAAIITALHSPPIEGLTEMWMVCSRTSTRKKVFDELTKLVSRKPTIGYEDYFRHVKKEKGIRISVPLLDAVKSQLGEIFQQANRRMRQADRVAQEIDFKQFDDFYRCAGDAHRGLRRDGLECTDEAAQYTERKLDEAEKWCPTMDRLMEKMKALQEGDLCDRKSRRQASLRLGFQVST